MAPKMKASKYAVKGFGITEEYSDELIKKHGLLSNGKLDIGVAGLAQLLQRKADKEAEKK
jgi:hypothetical protein